MMMVTPNIFLLPIKLGGRSLGVPVPISEKKKIALGVRNVIKAVKERMVGLSAKVLIDVLSSAIYYKGPAIERKFILYKKGLQNKHLLFKLFKKFKKKKNLKIVNLKIVNLKKEN